MIIIQGFGKVNLTDYNYIALDNNLKFERLQSFKLVPECIERPSC